MRETAFRILAFQEHPVCTYVQTHARSIGPVCRNGHTNGTDLRRSNYGDTHTSRVHGRVRRVCHGQPLPLFAVYRYRPNFGVHNPSARSSPAFFPLPSPSSPPACHVVRPRARIMNYDRITAARFFFFSSLARQWPRFLSLGVSIDRPTSPIESVPFQPRGPMCIPSAFRARRFTRRHWSYASALCGESGSITASIIVAERHR